jgi:hypothetical protein
LVVLTRCCKPIESYDSLHDNAIYAIDARWPSDGIATVAFDGVVALWTPMS